MIENVRTRRIINRDYSVGTHQTGKSGLYQISRRGLVLEILGDGGVLDTSGNGYNGTNNNGVYVDTLVGYQKQCWQGNGANAYIGLPTGAGLSLTGNQTYNFWIKLNGQPGTGLQYRLWNNYGSASPYGMFISYRDTAGVKDIIMSYGTTSTSSGSLTLTTGTTYMITCIHDDTNDIDKIYVNGTLYLSATGKTQNPASTTSARHIGAEDGTGKFTNGNIPIFRIYNRVLSDLEIWLHYLEGLKLLH